MSGHRSLDPESSDQIGDARIGDKMRKPSRPKNRVEGGAISLDCSHGEAFIVEAREENTKLHYRGTARINLP